MRLRNNKNAIEAVQSISIIKKIAGVCVFTFVDTPNNDVIPKFTVTGLVCFIFWVSIYCFCAYRAFSDDQTILRNIYDTKLRQYGDISERVVSSLFFVYGMWKIPFDTGLTLKYIQIVFEIDRKIEKLGVKIDYDKNALRIFAGTIAQVVAVATHVLSVWITLSYLEVSMPIEVIIQVSMADTLALIITAHICYYLAHLKERYEILNELLLGIRDRNAWQHTVHTVLIRSKAPVNSQMVTDYQDKCVSEKIRAYARIYGLLFKAVQTAEEMYGFALGCTLLFCLFYIVLYLFYFMEATATGLFHDTSRYIYFLVYVMWQIAYTLGVIFLNIFCSANVVAEAKTASYIVHEIINEDIGQSITTEFQGARTIVTLLVILLQFVMD
ncbi:uncharacterized protein LOC126366936 [Pectinophora gossypiella]|uniref:uncharacterized protein LOC126366936 n=1 Tax=Pectinophora gossypiella TaxID=13191 RepID=UPI00214E2683|nr:uncharacterized protein LOC126366936 [Pectinophora gossypiella]